MKHCDSALEIANHLHVAIVHPTRAAPCQKLLETAKRSALFTSDAASQSFNESISGPSINKQMACNLVEKLHQTTTSIKAMVELLALKE